MIGQCYTKADVHKRRFKGKKVINDWEVRIQFENDG